MYKFQNELVNCLFQLQNIPNSFLHVIFFYFHFFSFSLCDFFVSIYFLLSFSYPYLTSHVESIRETSKASYNQRLERDNRSYSQFLPFFQCLPSPSLVFPFSLFSFSYYFNLLFLHKRWTALSSIHNGFVFHRYFD